ncbi:MAG: type II toxin-antitoxin system ParD family antitoxin [Candidatus Thiodiazotropha sp. (ex Cardiolucina cf. quadrata)]|nr:type II toxin-antitoxin system ParD family antitoxin [Candidatus Thiodiazotropha sp. (ex Cardiolucina cf. quadrata)]
MSDLSIEVVRDALRHMEARNSKIAALQAYLAEGEIQVKKWRVCGGFFYGWTIELIG